MYFLPGIYECVYLYTHQSAHAQHWNTCLCIHIYIYIYTYIHDNHTSFCGRTSIQTRPKVYHPQVTPCGCSNCRKSLAGSPGITSVLPCENRAGFFWCRRLSSRVVWGKVALGCFDKGWKEVVMHEGFPVCGCFYDLDVLFIREFILTNPSFLSWLLGKLNGSIFCGSGIILKGQRFCYVYKYIYIYVWMDMVPASQDTRIYIVLQAEGWFFREPWSNRRNVFFVSCFFSRVDLTIK